MIDRPTRLLFSVVAFTIVAATVAIWMAGLKIVYGDVLQTAVICTALMAGAWWYRNEPSFRLCLTSLTIMVSFSAAFVMLTYALGKTRWPFADAGLLWWDQQFGFSADAVTQTMNSLPWLNTAMKLIYFSLLPQTALLIMWLGLKNSPRLYQFQLQFMLCGLVAAACFYFVPALGSCGTNAPSHYQKIVEDLLALRDGNLQTVSWRGAEGLIVFPSFHAVWGVLLILAFRWWPITILNSLMLLTIVPIGLHYGIDMIAGFLVCACMVPISNRLLARASAEDVIEQPVATPAASGLCP